MTFFIGKRCITETCSTRGGRHMRSLWKYESTPLQSTPPKVFANQMVERNEPRSNNKGLPRRAKGTKQMDIHEPCLSVSASDLLEL
eukprot:CAMPEP_0172461600 /NCGR_PEP_ID=MMETSP1065-20121228/41106_1 /TAXON_ID=265537 /ORGANISM="Amphiprora paludosa, Strain CCMP125" /LENGTH=85 /DNA_ID=CAMNT_0013216985 /DNA_START=513 /DNA_END=770 /DNA_ORIENTATION=-